MLRAIFISIGLSISFFSWSQFTITDYSTNPDGDSTVWELYLLNDSSTVFASWQRPVMDTLVLYDINTTAETFIAINETRQDSLIDDFFIGSPGLDFSSTIELPISSTSDTGTIVLEKVLTDENYDLDAYPVRSNVSLLRVTEGNADRTICSGTLIAPNMVLTSAHCLGNPDSLGVVTWNGLNNVYVAPSFSGGEVNSNYGKVKATHAFIPKQHYNEYQTIETFNNYDLGVLILEENIGERTGWMGMRRWENTNNTHPFAWGDDNIIHNTTSYNFSYPGQKGFNGKDMFFSHDIVTPNIFYTFSDRVRPHIVGQSGSSYFLMEDDLPMIFGVTYTETFQVTIPENFCRGINKIRQQSTLVGLFNYKIEPHLKLYPNPTTDYFTINSEDEILSVEVIDLLGNTTTLESKNERYSLTDYRAGTYLIKTVTEKGINTNQIIKGN